MGGNARTFQFIENERIKPVIYRAFAIQFFDFLSVERRSIIAELHHQAFWIVSQENRLGLSGIKRPRSFHSNLGRA